MSSAANPYGELPTLEQMDKFRDFSMVEGLQADRIREGDYAQAPPRAELLAMTLPPNLPKSDHADGLLTPEEKMYQLQKILEKKYGEKSAALVPEGIKQQMIRTFYGEQKKIRTFYGNQ